MTPTILMLVFIAVIFLRYFLVDLPKEKKLANKTYLLTRKDVARVVLCGLFVGSLAMSFTNLFKQKQIFGNDSYWLVIIWSIIYFIGEVFYRKVAVPFLNKREVSNA